MRFLRWFKISFLSVLCFASDLLAANAGSEVHAPLDWPLIGLSLVVGGLLVLVLMQNRQLSSHKRKLDSASETFEMMRDDLERKVNLRTSELAETNKLLQQEVFERKQSEQEQVRLERLRALAEMSVGVSHNLNNLLTGILGPVELLEMVSDDPQIRVYTDMIMRSARRAAEVVDRLHTAVHDEKSEGLVGVPVASVIQDAVDVTRPRWKDEAESRGVQIAMKLDLDEMPDVRGQVIELRDMFVNLIFNAVDAMPHGGTLHFTSRVEDRSVVVSVRDNGVGMDEAVCSRVFEPFFTTKMNVGSGLGLAIVHGTLRRWGGEVRVESTLGQGTTFTLKLPIWREKALSVDETKVLADADASKQKRILLVDDEEIVVNVIETALQRVHTVDTALSGRDALELWDQNTYDIALIDLGMPDMPGNRVAEAIKKADPRVMTVMVTGWRLDEDDDRLQWFDDVIEKPFENLDALRELVGEIAAKHDRRMKDE